MKKVTDLTKLIELARLAPKVEPKLDNSKDETLDFSNIPGFFGDLDIKGGKYEVKTVDLYKVYKDWDTTETNYKKFRKDLKEVVKYTKLKDKVKLNRKLITIEETYKDLYERKKDEEEE